MGKYINQIIDEEEFNEYLKLLYYLDPNIKIALFKSLIYCQGYEYAKMGLTETLCDYPEFKNGYDKAKKLERTCNRYKYMV